MWTTGNIDPKLVIKAVEDLLLGGQAAQKWLPRSGVSNATKPKAILPVDVFGQPANLDPIVEIARKYSLKVIEDACEALGAEYIQRKAGTIGDYGIYAFYPNKQITTGEGGDRYRCGNAANSDGLAQPGRPRVTHGCNIPLRI
jgi:dTDP-4-amino-4,6-dideoxygalactose transaminase